MNMNSTVAGRMEVNGMKVSWGWGYRCNNKNHQPIWIDSVDKNMDWETSNNLKSTSGKLYVKVGTNENTGFPINEIVKGKTLTDAIEKAHKMNLI